MLGNQIKSAAVKPKLLLKTEATKVVKDVENNPTPFNKPVVVKAATRVVDESSDEDEFDNLLKKNSATPLMERVKKRLGKH